MAKPDSPVTSRTPLLAQPRASTLSNHASCQSPPSQSTPESPATFKTKALTQQPSRSVRDGKMLAISFGAMVVFGLGNRVFNKLQTVPMHNYPFFLSLLTTFVYIPMSFAYIIPMIMCGNMITKEERQIPNRKFMVMGGLDAVAGIMQVFATNYLDGALVIMLMQVAIPVSMVLSYFLMHARYNACHILGATVVLGGLALVLTPQFTNSKGLHTMDLIWVAVLAGSCVPMALASIYKEKALGDQSIDPIYLNGQIAIWQFLANCAFSVPSAYAMPDGNVKAIPSMLINGLRCYLAINTQASDDCHLAPALVNIYLCFNLVYNILIILMIKYGGSNLLWLALALMVPLGSLTFSLPFVPGHKPLGPFGYAGLFVIVFGLVLYRFSDFFMSLFHWSMGHDQARSLAASELTPAQTAAILHIRGDLLDAAQPIIEGYTYSREKQCSELRRDQGTIRSGYLGRLGIRSASFVSFTEPTAPGPHNNV